MECDLKKVNLASTALWGHQSSTLLPIAICGKLVDTLSNSLTDLTDFLPPATKQNKKINKQQGKETTKTKQWQNNRTPPTTIPTATPTAGLTLAPTSLPSAKPTSQPSSISCASKSYETPHFSPTEPWKRKDMSWIRNWNKKPEQHWGVMRCAQQPNSF